MVKMKNFIKSFKLDRSFLKCMAFDLLFILIVLGIIAISYSAVISGTKPIYDFSNSAIKTQNIITQTGGLLPSIPNEVLTEAAVAYSQIKNLFAIWVVISIIIGIIIIGLSSILKGIIWSSVTEKEFNKKFILGLFKLNLIWYLSWLIIIFITFTLFSKTIANVIIAAEILLMFLLTPLIRVFYVPDKKTLQIYQHIRHVHLTFSNLLQKLILNKHPYNHK